MIFNMSYHHVSKSLGIYIQKTKKCKAPVLSVSGGDAYLMRKPEGLVRGALLGIIYIYIYNYILAYGCLNLSGAVVGFCLSCF